MDSTNFPHLNLIIRRSGQARLERGGPDLPQVAENLANRSQHATELVRSFDSIQSRGLSRKLDREQNGLPAVSGGTPFSIIVPEKDSKIVDYLSLKAGLEVVAQFEDGFLLAATRELSVDKLVESAAEFAKGTRGYTSLASVLEINDDPSSEGRLRRILGEELFQKWPFQNLELFTFDVSIECVADRALPKLLYGRAKDEPTRRKIEQQFEEECKSFSRDWDQLRIRRENEMEDFVKFYGGEILDIYDDSHKVKFPDSFSIRIRMSGAGFRDLVLNFPGLFEVVLPDEIDLPEGKNQVDEFHSQIELLPPDQDDPIICVIDSGIQEGHRLLSPALFTSLSRSFVPGTQSDDTADYVRGGGHGTSVAGALLYPEEPQPQQSNKAKFWIANARVLDSEGGLSKKLFPPRLLRDIAEKYQSSGVRVFNHSINSRVPCHPDRMSTWAATIDDLSFREDLLFIVSAGNLKEIGSTTNPGILDHLHAKREYPQYLLEKSCRIANPSQSLSALSVGSIARDSFEDRDRFSLAAPMHSSAFSRTGLGLWGSIKPELVEFGGDLVLEKSANPRLTTPQEVCPFLLRSTMYGGALFSRDKVGTSFAAPKVARIAGYLESLFPDRSTQLYRALIVNSARWPLWAELTSISDRDSVLRTIGYGVPSLDRSVQNSENRITLITEKDYKIKAQDGFVFGVPVPPEIRKPGDDYDVRVDVTLAYTSEPRRTFRGRARYLSVWLDWIASWKREPFQAFLVRALKDIEENSDSEALSRGSRMRWTIGRKPFNDGESVGISRSNGTVQKDWTLVKNFDLPEVFGVSVRGHKGWAHENPDAEALFSLVVSFEVIGADIPIYQLISEAISIPVSDLKIKVDS